jgi:hypothetical protein
VVDRAARRWAQLRQAWLALPEGDHQAAAEQLAQLSAQLTALHEPHADDADVDIALAIAAELAEGVRYACRWYEAVRTADPSQRSTGTPRPRA